MVEYDELDELLLWHPLTEAGPVPPVHDPDGIYPYPSFAETSRRPVLKRFRFAILENDFVRAVVCPDLGGKVHSLREKNSGCEVLFVPASVQPVRILPRLGFIAGGIEVSFPISHSPVQLERVEFQWGRAGDRVYLSCGERELHFGLRWTVEYSLGPRDKFLTQRTCFHNPTHHARPWMSWSNAALPARPDTQFHFPGGSVLRHGDELSTINWNSHGPRQLSDLKRMTGFFWQQPDCPAFGAFTPSLGHGLYHSADPATVPGIKLWGYGVGKDERWGRACAMDGGSYIELQGGPIRDQSLKSILDPGQTHCHVEHWWPTSVPLEIKSLAAPPIELRPLEEVPWLNWPPREAAQFWCTVLQAHPRGALSELPLPPGLDQNLWAPSGMDDLGAALRWAASAMSKGGRHGWLLQLGAWLAARGFVDEGLEALTRSGDDRAGALAGRLHRTAKRDARAAAASFARIQSQAMALHPQVMVERDLALAKLGADGLREREQWLGRASASQDEWIIERRAALLLDQGKPEQARVLMERTPFQLIHQRYRRTELWRRISQQLDLAPPHVRPELGEDDLAAFGAYREFSG
jgi:hypothetical protein